MIDKINLTEEVKEIFNILKENGYESFVVGGCCRDAIMGSEPHDWDLVTNALPDRIFKIFTTLGYPVIATGIKYGTVTVMVNGINYEITTFRSDEKYSDNRHPDKVNFVSTLRDDLSRRDFTINAIAYNDDVGFVDLFDGIKDIERKVIRCVGDPNKRLEEDELRILRALRFSSQLGFHIEGYTANAINKFVLLNSHSLMNVSKERITSEICKGLLGNNPEYMMHKLIMRRCIPELYEEINCSQNNKYHIYNVWEHTKHTLMSESTGDLIIRLALLFHDIGKPKVKTTDENGYDHFYSHAKISAEMTDEIMQRMKFGNDVREKVVELVANHDFEITPTKKHIRKMLNKLGEEQYRRLLNMRVNDILAHNMKYSVDRLKKVFDCMNLLDEVIANEECFSLKDLALNGKDVIELGAPEGPMVGEVLNQLLEEVLNETILNDTMDLIFRAREIILEKLSE